MSESKIIAVVGATGAQGGGLARVILEDADSRFSVRAITRNANSDAARELAASGAEVVEADLDVLDSLIAAFKGAYGAYCVTNFWEHFSPGKEQAQAHNLAVAARSASLSHVIWSTLEDTRRWIPLEDDRMPTLMERFKVPHFDAKGEANYLFTEAGVPTTFLLTSYYWENLISFGMGPKPGPDGTLEFVLPMADQKMPGIAVDDIGACAFGVFKAGDEFVGQTIGIAGEILTGEEMAQALGRALGQSVRYNAVSPAAYRSFDFPGADDLGNMFQFKQEFADDFCGARSIEQSRALNPRLQTFDQWLEANVSRIPLE